MCPRCAERKVSCWQESLLRQIFSRNQEEFTKAEPKTIPTIAVIEEAQAVLNERAAASEPFIAWVKEGRKYDLGAVLVTQQPGSIPDEILSQGDNWFLFHLLSASDLANVRKANAHFSNDILSSLLNEPIIGQGVFWSSAKKERAYPIALRVLSFEQKYTALDAAYPSHQLTRSRPRFAVRQIVYGEKQFDEEQSIDQAQLMICSRVDRARRLTSPLLTTQSSC